MTERIVAFLREIGLEVEYSPIAGDTFLPGITARNGVLIVDRERLLHPGDLLHEGGHLAVLPADERARFNGDAGGNGGVEMAAIAWSYAAALQLGVPLTVLFHESGYKGGAEALIENFSEGRFIGVPMLQWFGLASRDGEEPYPKMARWLRD